MSECACPPLSERPLGEGHVSVRFGPQRFIVTLGGYDVSDMCPEALAGEHGWALLYPDKPKMRCPQNPDHVRTIRAVGRVDVLMRHG